MGTILRIYHALNVVGQGVKLIVLTNKYALLALVIFKKSQIGSLFIAIL
jgi:phosphoglycolate phosphatase-like HAD superfamily hydrolase